MGTFPPLEGHTFEVTPVDAVVAQVGLRVCFDALGRDIERGRVLLLDSCRDICSEPMEVHCNSGRVSRAVVVCRDFQLQIVDPGVPLLSPPPFFPFRFSTMRFGIRSRAAALLTWSRHEPWTCRPSPRSFTTYVAPGCAVVVPGCLVCSTRSTLLSTTRRPEWRWRPRHRLPRGGTILPPHAQVSTQRGAFRCTRTSLLDPPPTSTSLLTQTSMPAARSSLSSHTLPAVPFLRPFPWRRARPQRLPRPSSRGRSTRQPRWHARRPSWQTLA